MFGHESVPSVNYSYGACEPEDVAAVMDQMRDAHRYRNKLVEIERARRKAVEESLAEMFPDLAAMDSRIAELDQQIETLIGQQKSNNAKARKLTTDPVAKANIKALKAERKDLYASRKLARREAFDSPAWKERQERIDANDHEERLAARAACGVWWCTYLTVETSLGNCRSGAPPQFLPWRGDGCLAVQIQGGMTPEEAFSRQDKRLMIEPLAEGVTWDGKRWRSGPGGPGKSKRCRTNVFLRIGSNGREPIWCKIPVMLHRPLPVDSRIKWVFLHRTQNGLKTTWSVRFVLSRQCGWQKDDLAQSGAVGIDVGWRVVPEGLRVAYWHGDDGRHGQLVIPNRRGENDWRYLIGKAEDLASIRDKMFNGILPRFAEWVATHSEQMPDGALETFKALSQWRSKTRLGFAYSKWRETVLALDADMAEAMDEWWKQDRHLHRWQVDNISHFQNQRKAIFRQFAAEITRSYRRIVVEKFDLRTMQREKSVEDKASEDAAMREHQRDANVSLLRQCLKERAAEFQIVDANNTTMACHKCGFVRDFNRSNLVNTCDGCGATWDQDFNAAVNIRTSASASVA